jgi:hypothetical protein
MRIGLLVVAVALVALAILILLAQTHGHLDQPLEITVRVIDAETGEPLVGAIVGTARWRDRIGNEHFHEMVRYALTRESDRPHSPLAEPVCATRTSKQAETVFESAVYLTTSRVLGIRVGGESHLPEALFIERPGHRRVVVPIDPQSPIEPGTLPDTWRLDLGTVRVP